jgi:uncharacterized protein
MQRVGRLVAIVAVALACTGQNQVVAPPATPAESAAEPSGLQPSEPFDVTTVTLVDPAGAAREIDVFDAHTPDRRRRGLMERTELPPDAGMVFRYPADSDGGFWMKNTLIPLSIAYFDADGVVHTVLDMEPCEADPCPSYPPGAAYRGALEVNQGFFADIGLEPGWRVELPAGLPPPEA